MRSGMVLRTVTLQQKFTVSAKIMRIDIWQKQKQLFLLVLSHVPYKVVIFASGPYISSTAQYYDDRRRVAADQFSKFVTIPPTS